MKLFLLVAGMNVHMHNPISGGDISFNMLVSKDFVLES